MGLILRTIYNTELIPDPCLVSADHGWGRRPNLYTPVVQLLNTRFLTREQRFCFAKNNSLDKTGRTFLSANHNKFGGYWRDRIQSNLVRRYDYFLGKEGNFFLFYFSDAEQLIYTDAEKLQPVSFARVASPVIASRLSGGPVTWQSDNNATCSSQATCQFRQFTIPRQTTATYPLL